MPSLEWPLDRARFALDHLVQEIAAYHPVVGHMCDCSAYTYFSAGVDKLKDELCERPKGHHGFSEPAVLSQTDTPWYKRQT